MWALLQPLIGPLFGALITGLLGLATTLIRSSRDQAAGATAASAATSAANLVTEAAIANAEATAPRTQAGVVTELNGGTF